MKTFYVYPDGSKVPDGICVRPEKHKTTLVIEIASIGRVSPSVIKRLLETKYEVQNVAIDTEVVTVAKSIVPTR